MFASKFSSSIFFFFSCKFKILLFSDPDNLLYCPFAAVVLRTWAENKLAGNSVQV